MAATVAPNAMLSSSEGTAPFYVYAAEKSTSQEIDIPVYYLTDRNAEGESYGPERKYPVQCLHDMYYGSALVPFLRKVPKAKGSELEEWQNRLGWHLANPSEKNGSDGFTNSRLDSGSDKANRTAFFANLAKAVADSKTNHLCIFVHGAVETFEDALIDAAELSYHMRCPALLYSWPSVGKYRAYHIDEGNCEWSQEHFDAFCDDISAWLEQHPEVHITLVAHSMGNRLVARATPILKRSKWNLSDVALVSPDIDAGTFMHYVMHYHNNGVKVRLYVSARDKMLSLTQLIYGGYYRLGEDVAQVLGMGARAKKWNEEGVDPDPRKSFEKIDFTELDSKGLGHELPFALVASMSLTGEPGDGLKLMRYKPDEENFLTTLVRWRYRKLNRTKNPAKNQESAVACQRVIIMKRRDTQSQKTEAIIPAF